ncbi:hypothetical protein DOTSEDRAFT_71610 [Dothistroma septosporum NZE10]|uniref:Uncharacterized protein n=1 Tax=Dothistroma septosporum (strain NZE10 / CBS 128990) TaxID=675120 RepID=N1PKH5_DOTSN|nr:hypothetical protein DOTSEDRAFT_71610 [Dothistroma septosporum NZE10]
MAISTLNADDTDEEWILLFPKPAPAVETRPSNSNAWIDWQLRTRFGTFPSILGPGPLLANSSELPVSNDDDKPIHPQTHSPLCRLPTLFRLTIYDHILRIPSTTPDGSVKLTHNPSHHRHPPSVPALLQTCRLILHEAEGISFTLNRLCTDHILTFIHSVGERRRLAVTKFTLKANSAAAAHIGLQALEGFGNLESLYLERMASVKYQDVRGWAVMTPQIREEIRGMGRLRVVRVVRVLMPEAADLTEAERGRARRLREIDVGIKGAVGRVGEVGQTVEKVVGCAVHERR